MATMTIRLDEELDARLSAVAAREGKTRSELARELLRRHLLVRDLDALRDRLRPYAEAAGSLTDEDFFREAS